MACLLIESALNRARKNEEKGKKDEKGRKEEEKKRK